MTKRITIVTHCYCPPGLDVYAEHLKHQWASLVRYPPRDAEVTLVVCCAVPDDDRSTNKVVQSLPVSPDNVSIAVSLFPLRELFRRAIGRNFAAKHSNADVFWFTDVDYLFGPGCLDAVARLVGPNDLLCQPAIVNISRTHQDGQKVVDANRGNPLPDIAFDTFVPRRQKVCIGGVQIVGGNTARRVGYCDGTKWVKPVDPSKGFRSCKCDKAFRRLNGFNAARLSIPGVYRLRHEAAGRDLDLDGRSLGRSVW